MWGEGATLDELEANVRAGMPPSASDYFAADKTWKARGGPSALDWWASALCCVRPCLTGRLPMLQIVMDAWGSPLTVDNSELYQRLGFLPFRGRVCLGDPDHTFRLIRASSQINGGMPPMPLRWFFCRQARKIMN